MATLEDISCDIKAAYADYRQRWYGGVPPVPAATLQIALGATTSGYVASEDKIYIFVGDGDVTDWEFKRDMPEAAWRIELIHEMLHEHQHKLVQTPSIAGRALFAKRPGAFSGNGHDERFYTAISDIAPKFGMTPEDFLDFV